MWTPRLFEWHVIRWIALFLALLLSIFAATQNRDAPLLILFIALYTIQANFSIPTPPTRIGFVPIIAAASLLILRWESALLALVVGLLLAELTAPLWRPLWQNVPDYPTQLRPRLGLLVVTVAAPLITALAAGALNQPLHAILDRFRLQGDPMPPPQIWWSLLAFSLAFFAVYSAGHFALAFWLGQRWRRLVAHHLPRLVAAVLLPQPLAWGAAWLYRLQGIPPMILGGIFLVTLNLLLWFSWLSRASLRRQMTQFASLNEVSAQLRESLDFEEVLSRTYEQVGSVMPLERFAIVLVAGDGRITRPLAAEGGRVTAGNEGLFEPDDFTRWVLAHGRPLEVDSSTLFYAEQHALTPPPPPPSLWLGYPLRQGSQVTGALTIHQSTPGQIVDSWSRELLVAIARQAGDAIENARAHRETLRLYSLTDEALTRRARQLQAILNSTREGFLMLDIDGRVVLANSVAETLLPLLTAGAAGPPAARSTAHQLGYDDGELADVLSRLQKGERPAARSEIVRIGSPGAESEGGVRYVERVESPVLGQDNRPLGWLVVLRDVTEQQERVEWRTQFTNMVVHDLRNPITTLLSSFDRLERSVEEGRVEGAAEMAGGGRRLTLNMLDMVDSLMDIARMDAGQIVADPEAMRLPLLVGRVVYDLLPLAFAREIELTFTYPEDLPAVWADEELTRRMLVNLLDNALKFTPGGGRINGFLGKEIPVDDRHEPGVRCTLIDTGPGIPEGARERIFERFVRIDSGGGQVRGTGVGLAFCRMAVEAQNGRIWVDDAPEGGGCFVFTLPGIPLFDPPE